MKLLFAPLSLAAVLALAPQTRAEFTDFTGANAFNNWSQVHVGGDSGIATLLNSEQIRLTSSDSGIEHFSYLDFVRTFAEPTTMGFSWNYATDDAAPGTDDAGWVLNGTYHQLVANASSTLNGYTEIVVNAGDTFGWRIRSLDNLEGSGYFTVTAAVPEPSTIVTGAVLALGLGGFGWVRYRRSKTSAQA